MTTRIDYEHAIDRIDRMLVERHRGGLGPGLSLALTTRDDLLATRTYGVTEVGTQKAVSDATLFQIGSITKEFIAVACLRLCEQGVLDLQAPVADVLEWFEVQSRFDTPLTIHHLLTHTGGLVMMNDCYPSSWGQVWSLRDTALGFEPGTRFSYSNVGYNVLQCVLQTLTGTRLDTLLRELIFRPLAMHDSWGEIRTDQLPRMARGHKHSHFDDRPVCVPGRQVAVNWYEMSAGCGSVVTTPTDLARFLRMLLRRGLADDGSRLLSERTFDAMIQPYAEMEDLFPGTTQGYGVLVEQSNGTGGSQRVIGGGENLGYEAAMYGDLAAGVGVILCNNSFDVCWNEVRYAMEALIAASKRNLVPDPPEAAPCDPKYIGEKARSYAGTYHGEHRDFTISERAGILELSSGGRTATLEPIYGDHFVAPHPAFERAMLSFGRDDGGNVVEAHSLGDWYRSEKYEGPTQFDRPSAWDAYVGQYRSFGILVTNFRVFVRKGKLTRQAFGGYVDQPLTDLGDGRFRIGNDMSPEILTFDCMARGKALRCRWAGGEFFRVDGP